ncbi:hypothetical protein L7F22_037874 [Adiantum nelumboides]|nr:hypothetical protein [Adiantum nelumboides]
MLFKSKGRVIEDIPMMENNVEIGEGKSECVEGFVSTAVGKESKVFSIKTMQCGEAQGVIQVTHNEINRSTDDRRPRPKSLAEGNCDDSIRDNVLHTEIQEKKLLLKQMQPLSFRGEGDNVEKRAEVWIEAMDDYFIANKTTSANQSMLSMFRLIEDAKLWWKQHCCDIGVAEDSQSWREIKQAIKKMNLPLALEALKMNKFFTLKHHKLSLEDYYSKFGSLRRYALAMPIEQQVAQFCQGLNKPISS